MSLPRRNRNSGPRIISIDLGEAGTVVFEQASRTATGKVSTQCPCSAVLTDLGCSVGDCFDEGWAGVKCSFCLPHRDESRSTSETAGDARRSACEIPVRGTLAHTIHESSWSSCAASNCLSVRTRLACGLGPTMATSLWRGDGVSDVFVYSSIRLVGLLPTIKRGLMLAIPSSHWVWIGR